MELTQESLAERSGVALSTLRKFEQKGVVSLESFLKLLLVVGGLEELIDVLKPSKPVFSTIDDVLKDDNRVSRKRGKKMIQPVGRLAIRDRIIYFEVMGEGKNPTARHLIKLGLKSKLPKELVESIIDQTKHALSRWKGLAAAFYVTDLNIKSIESKMNQINKVFRLFRKIIL